MHRPQRLPLFEEGAEGRDAGPGADHDHRRVAVIGELEAVRRMHEDPDLGARLDPLGEEGRGDPFTLPFARSITDHAERQVDFSGVRPG